MENRAEVTLSNALHTQVQSGSLLSGVGMGGCLPTTKLSLATCVPRTILSKGEMLGSKPQASPPLPGDTGGLLLQVLQHSFLEDHLLESESVADSGPPQAHGKRQEELCLS